jgi:membrane protease subunit HflC
MNKILAILGSLLALGLIVISQSIFIVDQREQAIVLQLGQPLGNPEDPASFIKQPGLHFKIPVIQNVQMFDRRVLSVEPPSAQVVISSARSLAESQSDKANTSSDSKILNDGKAEPEKVAEDDQGSIGNESGEPIIVDTFARYKITDPLQFLKTLRTTDNANSRLENILNDTTRAVLGKTTLPQLLSTRRASVMSEISKRVNAKIKQDQLGVEIIDVRIVRADLTADLRDSTVRRMNSELKERATETRAKGEEKALEIRSTADKLRTVLIAEAQRDAQKIKGQGDEEAIRTYTAAFNKDAGFYSFIRSLEAYKETMSNPETQLILSPDSEFFKHFQNKSSP